MGSWKKSFELNRIATLGGLLLTIALAPALLCSGCETGEREAAQLQFAKSGIFVTGLEPGVQVGSIEVFAGGEKLEAELEAVPGGALVRCQWKPEERYRLKLTCSPAGSQQTYEVEAEATAPLLPGLALLSRIDLRQWIGAPDATPSTSPTECAVTGGGEWCAVGSGGGDVLLFPPADPTKVERFYMAGAYIRSLAFAESEGGTILLVGEQSPRGGLSAFAVGGGANSAKLWYYETARDIGASLRNPDDPYGWAHLPGVYRIVPVPPSDVLVLATHSPAGDAPRASVLYRITVATGEVLWRWPARAPLAATATWFDAGGGGRVLALCAYDGDGKGFLVVIDGSDGTVLRNHEIAPPLPAARSVSFWRGVSVSPGGDHAALISNDGRGWMLSTGADDEVREVTLGAPLLIGDVPVMISGAAVAAGRRGALFVTGTTYIPWEASDGGHRPPQPHPSALTAIAVSWSGEALWSAPVPSLAQGLADGPGGECCFIAYASDPVFAPGGADGMLVMDLSESGGRIAAAYPVRGSVVHGSPHVFKAGVCQILIERSRRTRSGEELIGSSTVHVLGW